MERIPRKLEKILFQEELRLKRNVLTPEYINALPKINKKQLTT